MKTLKIILLVLIILAIAVFTGTWIFEVLSWIFTLIGKFFTIVSEGLVWLAGIMDFFHIGGILL